MRRKEETETVSKTRRENFSEIRVIRGERQTDFRSCRSFMLRSPDRCSSTSASLCFCSPLDTMTATGIVNT